jgi:hypothetical protein
MSGLPVPSSAPHHLHSAQTGGTRGCKVRKVVIKRQVNDAVGGRSAAVKTVEVVQSAQERLGPRFLQRCGPWSERARPTTVRPASRRSERTAEPM